MPAGAVTTVWVLQHARSMAVARLDALLLVAHHWRQSRTWLTAHDLDDLPHAIVVPILNDMAARARGVPLAYLTGTQDFYGLTLRVTSDVLIPRPETEHLVDWALELLASHHADSHAPVVVDLGTGSGALALAIKHACPRAVVHAVDASGAALAVARGNAQALNLNVSFHQGDWWQGGWLAKVPRGIAVVVSNPPYVASGDAHLAALQYEPASALVAPSNGLGDLLTIVSTAANHLPAGASLLLEHGHDHAPAVRTMLLQHPFFDVGTRLDLAGHPRCTGGRRSAAG